MVSYTISKKANVEAFKCICKILEEQFSNIEKPKPLIDVDGSVYQNYCVDGKMINVNLDYYIYAVYIDSELELDSVLPFVNVLDEFHTTLGNIINVDGSRVYKTGDIILTGDGVYRIANILLPTRPNAKDVVSLVVQSMEE